MLTSGALCKGYGGLELAAESVLGPLEHLWYAEFDPALTSAGKPVPQYAAQVAAAHWPDVPNLGDLTAVDWAALPRVDVLTAGFPCTDVSAAGKRAGLKPGTRTGIWSHIAYGIGVLRPPLVFLENVEGLLSARAHSDVEPCPWCLGDVDPDLVVRALGAVLADLAALGFDAEWATVPASDVGAPHRRKRVFIVAWPAANPPRFGHGHAGQAGVGRVPAAPVAGGAGADGLTLLPTPRTNDMRGPGVHGTGGPDLRTAVSLLPTPRARDSKGRNANPRGVDLNEAVALLPTPAAQLGDRRGTPNADTAQRRMHEQGRRNLEDAIALLPTPRATDGTKGGPNQRGSSGDLMLPSAVMQLLPTLTATDAKGGRNATANRTNPKPTTTTTSWTLSDVAHADRWGSYAPAITRWEQVVGRPAPDPTEPGANGQPRLSPVFVEWLMGLPVGWVTDHVPRNGALKCLGNGVVPQQAAHAYATLLNNVLSHGETIELPA
jgi:DNA (cytosine-5)-methyltransferase 1